MNVHEGARRMKRAGKWLVMMPVAAILILSIIVEIGALFAPGKGDPAILFPLCLPLLVPGILLWIAGWIVEGFAQKERP